MNKIFEVGVSESLREHMRRFNLDIIEKVANISHNQTAYEASNAIFSFVYSIAWLFF